MGSGLVRLGLLRRRSEGEDSPDRFRLCVGECVSSDKSESRFGNCAIASTARSVDDMCCCLVRYVEDNIERRESVGRVSLESLNSKKVIKKE